MFLYNQKHILIKCVLLHLNHYVSLVFVIHSINQIPLGSHDIFTIPIWCVIRWNALIFPLMLFWVFLSWLWNFKENLRLVARADWARLWWARNVPEYIIRDDILFDTKLIIWLSFAFLGLLICGQSRIATTTLGKVAVVQAPLTIWLLYALLAVIIVIAETRGSH